jgi:hypothetical protein
MLDGLDRLLEQESFSGERGIDEKRDIADAWGNVLDRFKYNILDVTGNPNDLVHKGDLWDLLNEFADHIGKSFSGNQQKFTADLKKTPDIDDGQTSRIDDPSTTMPRVFKGVRIRFERVDEFSGSTPRFALAEDKNKPLGQQDSL